MDSPYSGKLVWTKLSVHWTKSWSSFVWTNSSGADRRLGDIQADWLNVEYTGVGSWARGRDVFCWTSVSRYSKQLGNKGRVELRKKSNLRNKMKGSSRRGARGCSQGRKQESQKWGKDISRDESGANSTHSVHSVVKFL